jgi:predicted PurR-regulated permease PerM
VLGSLPAWAVASLGLVVGALALLLGLEVAKLAAALVFQGLGEFLTVILIAGIAAYLLDPLVDRFEAARWSRTAAILVGLLLFAAFASVLVLLLVPYVVTEIAELTANLDGYTQRAGERLRQLEQWLRRLPGGDRLPLHLDEMSAQLPALLKKLPAGSLDPVGELARRVVGSTFGVLGALVRWSLFPIFTFFFLRDFDTIKRGTFSLVPWRFRDSVSSHWRAIDTKMSLFVRGQLMVCLALAVLYALGLGLFTQIHLAVLVGVLAGLLFIIPYLGTVLGIVAGTLLAFLEFGPGWEMVKVWMVFGVVQSIEGMFLTPKIVGDSVGLHPVVVMLALIIGGNLFGLLGIVLAVPAAATLQVLLETAVKRMRGDPWFLEGRPPEPQQPPIPPESTLPPAPETPPAPSTASAEAAASAAPRVSSDRD